MTGCVTSVWCLLERADAPSLYCQSTRVVSAPCSKPATHKRYAIGAAYVIINNLHLAAIIWRLGPVPVLAMHTNASK